MRRVRRRAAARFAQRRWTGRRITSRFTSLLAQGREGNRAELFRGRPGLNATPLKVSDFVALFLREK
jgi:hypothetical protein